MVWSPTGDRVAYTRLRKKGDETELSIESCALSGTERTTIVSDNKLASFAWIAPGRLIYSRYLGGGNDYYSTDLWELIVEPRTGAPQGKPRRLTDWSGFQASNITATADGKHLAFVRGAGHESVLVAELEDNNSDLKGVHSLTLEDFSNIPLAWTQDSNQVIFSSQRSGARQIYKQALDGSAPPQLVTQDPTTEFFLARLAPDGDSWFVGGCPPPTNKCGLYRVGTGGGSPQFLFETGSLVRFNCSNRQANLCAFGQTSPDNKNLMIASFGVAGKGKELATIPVEPARREYSWALSPDGSKIAFTTRDAMIAEIRIISLRGEGTRTMTLRGYSNLESVDWMPDSKSMFVGTAPPSGAALLRVTLDGSVRPVWKSQTGYVWGIPSPDGRHIAVSGRSWDANVWMIDNF
jgi:Tol biopolymer transport system component